MTDHLLLRPEAQADLEETALWYEDQKLGLGVAFSDEFFSLLLQITQFPLRFPTVMHPVRRGLLRRFPYAVYFVIEESVIVVFAVLDQRRDPDVWKRRV